MEPEKWLEKAIKDLDDARFNLDNGRMEVAAFLAQQSAEKALKALYLKKFGKVRKIHDLVLLGRDVGLPVQLLDGCKELTAAYMYARYPDIPETVDINKEAKKFVEFTGKVLGWTRNHL